MEALEFNPEEHLAAVDRSVLMLEREGQPASAVTISRSFPASVEKLWDATTMAESIGRWFTPVSGELKLGGRYQLEGNAGGVITECERLKRFALTWEFAGDVSWVEVEYSEDAEGSARLTLTHTALLSPHWTEFGPGAVGVGWEMGLLGLSLHLSYPEEPMPDEAAFAASDEGRRFIAGSSRGWGEASIAAGTEPSPASVAADRTTAFYTGETGETN